MNVDSYTDDRSAIPTLKKSLSDKLTIGGMKEDVYYTIEAIDNELFGSIKDTPKVGERISMRYSFQGYDDDYGQYGYERLYLGCTTSASQLAYMFVLLEMLRNW